MLGLVMGLIGLQLIGCSNEGSKSTTENLNNQTATESKLYLKDIDVEENVVLGDYKGIEAVKGETNISEEELDSYIAYLFSASSELKEVTDRDVVENGDVVNIDFEGKKDGVAFDGGTSQGYDLEIGSGSFIAGFEEGLVGVKKGETVDLNLTFPENYGAADLAGEDVVFTVTVNGIYASVTPELTDEYVAGLGMDNVATVEEYRAYWKSMLEESKAQSVMQDVEAQILTQITEAATVTEVPQALVDKFYDATVNTMTYQASVYGMDLETFMAAYYGMDSEAFEAENKATAEVSAKQALVCLKIAKEEGISVSDEELNAAVEERYAEYGSTSADDFKAMIDVEEFRDSLLLNKVVDFLVENATITEVTEITE